MREQSRRMALAGMMTALCVVVMSLGSLIPVNTYICPVLCMLVSRVVLLRCGVRLGWCCYLAVAVLSLLLAPDREAAAVYVCMGCWPMVRGRFEKIKPAPVRLAAKVLFFTVMGLVSFGLGMVLLGTDALLEEYRGPGIWLALVTLVLWDGMMLVVDRILDLRFRRKR